MAQPYIYNAEFESKYTRLDDEPIGLGTVGSVWRVTLNENPTQIYAAKLYNIGELPNEEF